MPNELETPNVPIVSYVSPELLSIVQRAARNADRSLAAEIRHQLQRLYTSKPQIEKR